MSVQSMWEIGKDFCPNFLQPFLENIDRGSGNDGAYSSISQPSPKMPTLSFSVGSHLGVLCRGALLDRFEQEGGKASSDQYPKYLEGGNQVSSKSSSPQQSLFVGEVTHASYQPCSLSLDSL